MLSESELTRLTNSPAPAAGDTLDILLAKLAAGRVVKKMLLLYAGDLFALQPGFLYSVAVITGAVSLAVAGTENFEPITEGVSVEFLTSEVYASILAYGEGALVQIVIY